MGDTVSSLTGTNSHRRLDSFNHDEMLATGELDDSTELKYSAGDDTRVKSPVKGVNELKLVDPRSPSEGFMRTPVYCSTDSKAERLKVLGRLTALPSAHRQADSTKGELKSSLQCSANDVGGVVVTRPASTEQTSTEDDMLLYHRHANRHPLSEVKKNKIGSALFRTTSLHSSSTDHSVTNLSFVTASSVAVRADSAAPNPILGAPSADSAVSGCKPDVIQASTTNKHSPAVAGSTSISIASCANVSPITVTIDQKCMISSLTNSTASATGANDQTDGKAVTTSLNTSSSSDSRMNTTTMTFTTTSTASALDDDEIQGEESERVMSERESESETNRVRARLTRFNFRSPTALLANKYSLIAADD